MDDKDNLYFSFDDEKEEPAEEKEVKAEEGQNRSFVVVAVVLGAVFVLGICAVVGYLFFGNQIQAMLGGGAPVAEGPSANELTNQFMQTAIALTATTNFETQSAPTAQPSKTPAPKPSVTPTSSIGQTTEVGTQDGTQIAEVTQEGTPGGPTPTKGLSGAATTAPPTTGTPGTPGTPGTASAAGAGGTTITPTVKVTSSIIEVTAIGSGPTPTKLVSGVGTGSPTSSIIEVTGGQGGGTGGTPTGVGGPTTPGATATIPATGFGGGAGLAGAGLLAMLLVVVVVVVRKIRFNQ